MEIYPSELGKTCGGIETKNPINAKSVQLIELHAFACDLVCIYLSESFDFLKVRILYIVAMLVIALVTGLLATGISIALCTGTTLCTALGIHLGAGGLEGSVQFGHGAVNGSQVLSMAARS